MVVRLVLEQKQPVLVDAVHVDLHLHGAGVDLLGFVEVGQDALGFQVLRADGAHVHQADRLLVASQLVAHLEVLRERLLDHGVIEGDLVEHGAERGMAAMVGPVGVDHLDLGDRGIAALLVAEILLEEHDVGQIHRQPALGDERRQALFVELAEALEHLHRIGLCDLKGQRVALGHGRLARLDGVDHVVLDGVDVLLGQISLQVVHLRGAHLGALALADQLNALAGAVGALVELAGKILHREHRGALRVGQLAQDVVGLRLAEHRRHALLEQLGGDALHVIAVQKAHARKRIDPQDIAQLGGQPLRFDVEPGLLFNIDAGNHSLHPSNCNFPVGTMIRHRRSSAARPVRSEEKRRVPRDSSHVTRLGHRMI